LDDFGDERLAGGRFADLLPSAALIKQDAGKTPKKGIPMPRMLLGLMIVVSLSGCASRPGWGFPWGQGTTERQNARAVIHDPYPLNDIGPEVVGGRPRGYFNPQHEAKRQHATDQFPKGFSFGQQ
jgi:hypothetical protein